MKRKGASDQAIAERLAAEGFLVVVNSWRLILKIHNDVMS